MRESKQRSTEIHMESGPVGRTLLAFTLPVLLSQLLQELYSIADCMVVGHFGGDYGLAATGIGSLVLSVLINFFVGFSSGISVVTAQCFGSYEYERLKKLISTLVRIGCLLGILLCLTGVCGRRLFLAWLNCPKDVFEAASLYLFICFWGMVPQLLYNIGNAILRSLGNTRIPLYYLCFSAALNLVLDLILAAGCGLGLAGAAVATLFSQWLLGLLILHKLLHLAPEYRVNLREERLPLPELVQLLKMGVPSGLQAVFMSISSLVIQVSINAFGADAVAGMTVFAKVEGFLYYPSFAYGMALTGFIGQNIGAGRMDRVREAMRTSVRTAVCFTLAASLLLMMLSGKILLCFTKDPAILASGQEAIHCIFPFYFLYAANQVYIGGVKGLGNTGYPMVCSLICYCIFRVAWCRLLLPVWWDMRVVYTCYDASWILMLLLLAVKYRRLYCARAALV